MNIVAFVVGIVLFLGGIALFAYSWDGTTFVPFAFAGGIVAITASIAIPASLLKRIDG